MKRLGTLPLTFFSLPPTTHVPENSVPGLPSIFSVTSLEGAVASAPSPFAVLKPPTLTTASPSRATAAVFPARTMSPAFFARCTWWSDSSGACGAISAVVGSFTLYGCAQEAAKDQHDHQQQEETCRHAPFSPCVL